MPYEDPEEAVVVKSHLTFPVVGIGASAGGISALQRLLATLPADPGMAFVVVMHLSPEHQSTLGDILERSGPLPVHTVFETTPIEVNHVYVISPALKLVMTDGHLRVSPRPPWKGGAVRLTCSFAASPTRMKNVPYALCSREPAATAHRACGGSRN